LRRQGVFLSSPNVGGRDGVVIVGRRCGVYAATLYAAANNCCRKILRRDATVPPVTLNSEQTFVFVFKALRRIPRRSDVSAGCHYPNRGK
jgi:hypothetical protein